MKRNILSILLLGLSLAGCRKYSQTPESKQAAYFRVFNGLTNFSNYGRDITTLLQDKPVSARISVFIDPDSDRNGILNTSAIADNLYPKLFFTDPHPDQAGNKILFDVDYPGSKIVNTSPETNGLDLSRWAAITSGKHRFVFTALPIGQTTAGQINSIRFNTIIDTTIDMTAGHYYTLQPMNDSNRFRLYFREEGFESIHLDTSKINVRFVNLCKGRSILPDTFDVYYRYHYFTDPFANSSGVFLGYVEADDTANTYLTTVTKRFGATPADAPYVSIPLAPDNLSYWPSGAQAGTIKPDYLRPCLVINLCKPGQKPNHTPGTSTNPDPPLLQFVCTEAFTANLTAQLTNSNVSVDSLLPAYYTKIPIGGYALYSTASANNTSPGRNVATAGELWNYTFISGLATRRQALISTIEFTDNYTFLNGQPNTYNTDKTQVRIYVTGVQPFYGNPYNQ